MTGRKLILFAALVACLALAGPAWAGSVVFSGNDFPSGQGDLSFSPGLLNKLTIAAGGGGNGALVTDLLTTGGAKLCGGDCPITNGYLVLTTGGEISGSSGGGLFAYDFAAGGNIKIYGGIGALPVGTELFMATLGMGTFNGGGSVGSVTAGINLASIVLNPALGVYKYTGANNNDISFNVSPSCSTGGICNGTIVNSMTSLQTIPEPATLSVLGVGLFTFGAGLRRRMAARKAV
jgi:PEP-CTERM motif